MTKSDLSLERIAEMMNELAAYVGQTVVIKIGGNSLDEDPEFLPSLVEQLEFLQSRHIRIVLVHGGGPQIDRALAAENIVSVRGPDGRRLTSPAIMAVVARTMAEISQTIAAAADHAGCKVFTAANVGNSFVEAVPLCAQADGDRTGMPARVDTKELSRHLDDKYIVILNSVGLGADGHDFNINADDFAMAVAMALGAKRLLMATNVKGVLGPNKTLVERLSPTMADQMIKDGIIAGGMIPKVESALRALDGGVGGVVIIDAHVKWSLLGEILTHKGFGTLIAKE